MRTLTLGLAFAALPVSAAHADPRNDKVHTFVSWAEMAESDGRRAGGPPDSTMFERCLEAYDAALRDGIPADEPVKVHGRHGTMEALKNDICAAGKGVFDKKVGERVAPYKKLLRNDKLSLALEDDGAIRLSGGAPGDDPARLAAAAVWFLDSSPPSKCADGRQVHRVHRYQFDGQQKLVKTTDKDYCGSPPATAFR